MSADTKQEGGRQRERRAWGREGEGGIVVGWRRAWGGEGGSGEEWRRVWGKEGGSEVGWRKVWGREGRSGEE